MAPLQIAPNTVILSRRLRDRPAMGQESKMGCAYAVEASQLTEGAKQPLPEGFLDRLRAGTSIAHIATRWVKWDARKSNPAKGDYWSSCPFHQEQTASFHVDDGKGFYYCFGCHAKGDATTLLKEKGNMSFMQAVRLLAFIAGMDGELQMATPPGYQPPTILQLKEIIVKHFTKENFLEVGFVTGWSQQIRQHSRLLRSLDFGDDDYSGNVLEILAAMDARKDGSIEKLQGYVAAKFSDATTTVIQTGLFTSAKPVLGYTYSAPRKDIIAVMMPFKPQFHPVYAAIERACAKTPLKAKRADQVWENSVVIHDILELINHAAVVVCDLTGKNENVFYELGIAHAWDKVVVPITQNAADVPFDLGHHRYLHYLNNAEGLAVMEADLSKRLVGLLGESHWF